MFTINTLVETYNKLYAHPHTFVETASNLGSKFKVNSFPPASSCSRREMDLSIAKVEKAKELHTFRR